jgi:hypothetical protein
MMRVILGNPSTRPVSETVLVGMPGTYGYSCGGNTSPARMVTIETYSILLRPWRGSGTQLRLWNDGTSAASVATGRRGV